MRGVNLNTSKTGSFDRSGAHTETTYNFFDLGYGQRCRFAELPSGQANFYRRGCLRVRVNIFLCLSAGVTDLCPEVIAIVGSCLCPARKCCVHCRIDFALNDDIARTLQVIPIDENIP